MDAAERIIARIELAFGGNEHPGDSCLQDPGDEGEAWHEVAAFRGAHDWKRLAPSFLDARAGALSFFSQAGFRYFLPAYLVADLRGSLSHADPVFHLTYGFSDTTVAVPRGAGVASLRTGKSEFVNPRRYGAMTFQDYARYRLSVFTREEAGAIQLYLERKRELEPVLLERERIDAALRGFWTARARSGPSSQALRFQAVERAQFLSAAAETPEARPA